MWELATATGSLIAVGLLLIQHQRNMRGPRDILNRTQALLNGEMRRITEGREKDNGKFVG